MTLPHRALELEIVGFRNISRLELELAPKLNILSGDNGQGKTSVLEALYLLSTSRSFRTERLREVQQDGTQVTRVRARFLEGDVERVQRAMFANGRRSLFIDDKAPERLSAYAVRTPVVVFHPGDLELVGGPAALRRRLLDRIALFVDPASTETRLRYQKAQKERQAVLIQRGIRAPELDAFEHLMARYGLEVKEARAQATAGLTRALMPAFGRMAAIDLQLSLAYLPGGANDAMTFKLELERRREGDRRRGSSSYGPGRDDLELSINGRSARRHASQGQQRVLALALKVAELSCIRDARGLEPLLLLDDVSSELDPTRVGAVYDFIRASESQVFVTTTRPELFATAGYSSSERRDFKLAGGRLEGASEHQ